MDREELLRRYTAGERDFTEIDLTGISITEEKLNGINFSQAILKKAYFNFLSMCNANLRGVDLSDASFSNCNFEGSDFRNANLERSNFYDCRLDKCNFEGANLKNACLENVLAYEANFRNALLEGCYGIAYRGNTIMPDGTVFSDPEDSTTPPSWPG